MSNRTTTHLLLLDEDPLRIFILADRLKAHGYRITTATSIPSVWRLLQNRRFDALVAPGPLSHHARGELAWRLAQLPDGGRLPLVLGREGARYLRDAWRNFDPNLPQTLEPSATPDRVIHVLEQAGLGPAHAQSA